MKAEDMMVGNFVYFGVNIVPIKSIHIESVLKDTTTVYIELNKELSHYCVDISEIEPIPLSEEILLKCGFIYFESNNSYQLDTIYGFSFWGRIGEGFNCYCQSEEFGTTFNFLHELQNRFYSLTKQELEIKW